MSAGLQDSRTGGKGKLPACTTGGEEARLHPKQVRGLRSEHAHQNANYPGASGRLKKRAVSGFSMHFAEAENFTRERQNKSDVSSIPPRGDVAVVLRDPKRQHARLL